MVTSRQTRIAGLFRALELATEEESIRADAFEEAAKVLDAEAATLPDLPDFGGGPKRPGSVKTRVMRLAATIRRLGGGT